MLFMTIYTYEPGQRNEVVKRRQEKGLGFSEGVKVVREWLDIGGGRGFTLIETNDPKASIESTRMWSDLMKMEVIPVIETAKLFEGVKK